MREMRRRGRLFFVDSRTTGATVAQQLARENAVPNIARDIFLDSGPHGEPPVERQFERLLARARGQGTALAIGHPYPGTLAVLERRLARLGADGVRLVPVSRLIELQQRRERPWQAYSSPWHRVARNWKPSP